MLKRWTIGSDAAAAEYRGHRSAIKKALVLRPGLIASMADDHTIRIWSEDGKELEYWIATDGPLSDMLSEWKGNLLVLGGYDPQLLRFEFDAEGRQ